MSNPYLKQFNDLISSLVTFTVLYGIGDYIAQKATGTQNSINDKVHLKAIIEDVDFKKQVH